MESLTAGFWLQLLVYAVSIGSFAGVILTKIGYLEKKMDKHNGLVERMVTVEQKCSSAHHRIDEIRDERGRE